jgi:parallel beta-helix repeat protein
MSDINSLKEIVRIGNSNCISPNDVLKLQEYFLSTETLVKSYASWALANHKEIINRTYHVNNQIDMVSDINSGSEENPFKTIQEASNVAIAGDTIIVHNGTYRECIKPCHSGKINAPIIYRAADAESPIIKACDIWYTKWKKEDSCVYSTKYSYLSWDKPNRFRPNIPENRCEQIFIYGRFLNNVRTKDDLYSHTNSFWINDTINEIWISSEYDPNNCIVERSVREQCFMPTVKGLEYIYLKGFTFIGGAAHVWTGGKWHHVDQQAVVSLNAGRHWLVEDNIIEYGNAQGLQVAVGGCFVEETKVIPIVHAPEDFVLTYKTTDVSGYNTIRGNTVRYNGISGIVGFGGMNNIIIENNTVVGNCTKNYTGTCEESGIKFHVMIDSIIRNNVVSDNNSYGIWLDGLCKRNRISQNILVNNTNYPIFYELSEGPTLIDNNVIIDTRDTPVTIGLYNQDGNNSIVINNAIIGPDIGIKVRSLFHRKYENGMTTTKNNYIYNNVISRCKTGCVSLMPEVTTCANNHSNYNMLWSKGNKISCVLDNSSDVGVAWETLPLGRALGYKGSGTHSINIEDWKQYYLEDRESYTISSSFIFIDNVPNEILNKLTSIWKKRNLDLTSGYTEVLPLNTSEWLSCINDNLIDSTLKYTMWTSTYTGFQIWETSNGLKKVPWNNLDIGVIESIELNVPYQEWAEPILISAGDIKIINTNTLWNFLIEPTFDVVINSDNLIIKITDAERVGSYGILLASDLCWTYIPVYILNPFDIISITSKCSIQGKYVIISVRNNTSKDAIGFSNLSINDKYYKTSLNIPSKSTLDVDVKVDIVGITDVVSTIYLNNKKVTKSDILSFAEASRSDTWIGVTRYEINRVLPIKESFIVKEQKRTTAGWRVRYNDKGIIFKIEVEHKFHNATRSDMEGLHCGDCIKLAIGAPGKRSTVIGMSLRSDTLEQICGFNKTIDEEKYPVGQSKTLKATVNKRNTRMVYDLVIPWDILGSEGPISGTSFPLSILVCKDDSDINYEMLWFNGIRYDEDEGKESAMGQLWII